MLLNVQYMVENELSLNSSMCIGGAGALRTDISVLNVQGGATKSSTVAGYLL